MNVFATDLLLFRSFSSLLLFDYVTTKTMSENVTAPDFENNSSVLLGRKRYFGHGVFTIGRVLLSLKLAILFLKQKKSKRNQEIGKREKPKTTTDR